MPNIKSAIKRVKQSARRTEINKHKKSELKTVVKNAHQALDASQQIRRKSFDCAEKR